MASHDRFRIVGGTSLRGEVSVGGAKNSVLKLMAASLLATGSTTIRNVPDIADVDIAAFLVLAKRLRHEIDSDIAGDRVGHDQRRRGEEVRADVRMNPRLEVTVTR